MLHSWAICAKTNKPYQHLLYYAGFAAQASFATLNFSSIARLATQCAFKKVITPSIAKESSGSFNKQDINHYDHGSSDTFCSRLHSISRTLSQPPFPFIGITLALSPQQCHGRRRLVSFVHARIGSKDGCLFISGAHLQQLSARRKSFTQTHFTNLIS